MPWAAVEREGRRFVVIEEANVQSKLLSALVLCAVIVVCMGCGPEASSTSEVTIDLTVDPSPPVVGDATISLALSDADGKALAGADVLAEGNMNHAGMKPSFADLREVEPGRYSGTLDFTMGGDWFILVTAKTRDGKTAERKFDVPGVKSP